MQTLAGRCFVFHMPVLMHSLCTDMDVDPEYISHAYMTKCIQIIITGVKVYLSPKIIFDMWKGHSLEVHCTNIQLNIFIKYWKN